MDRPNPARRIPAEIRDSLLEILSKKPGDVKITWFAGDVEAQRFATDWAEVLEAAGWRIKAIGVFHHPEPLYGVQVVLDGAIHELNPEIKVLATSPGGCLLQALKGLNAQPLFVAMKPRIGLVGFPAGNIELMIALRPEEKK